MSQIFCFSELQYDASYIFSVNVNPMALSSGKRMSFHRMYIGVSKCSTEFNKNTLSAMPNPVDDDPEEKNFRLEELQVRGRVVDNIWTALFALVDASATSARPDKFCIDLFEKRLFLVHLKPDCQRFSSSSLEWNIGISWVVWSQKQVCLILEYKDYAVEVASKPRLFISFRNRQWFQNHVDKVHTRVSCGLINCWPGVIWIGSPELGTEK